MTQVKLCERIGHQEAGTDLVSSHAIPQLLDDTERVHPSTHMTPSWSKSLEFCVQNKHTPFQNYEVLIHGGQNWTAMVQILQIHLEGSKPCMCSEGDTE